MPNPARLSCNFTHLHGHDDRLVRLGMLAERYFAEDPNTTLIKLRQLAELLAQFTAANIGLDPLPNESQFDLLRRLRTDGVLPFEVFRLFEEIRRTGNEANHALAGDHGSALTALKYAREIAIWFHRTFSAPDFKPGPFIPPQAPKDESESLKAELARLRSIAEAERDARAQSDKARESLENELRAAKDEQTFWEEMATKEESEKNALLTQLASVRETAAKLTPEDTQKLRSAAELAAGKVELDEAGTRKLIDEQLRQAGWDTDTSALRYSNGSRPVRGKNRAIAEWPTQNGPADYVLFIGLTPVAVIEAKRAHKDIPAVVKQAERYARGFTATAETQLPPENHGPAGEFRIPFVFASNGRPFLRQMETKSGIWFRDLRRASNLSRALSGWFSPDGLAALLKTDVAVADTQLRAAGFDYGFTVRPYQQSAIRAAEEAIANQQRALLIAMATGTGKTKTCIALIYRLLKTGRFRRILFLVDRSALGVQAIGDFQSTKMENLQNFADIFALKVLADKTPDGDTAVHVATIQGMAKRVLAPEPGEAPPCVDTYDCIVVDECHRGYLLDRELSETELTFRSFEDYVSKYRRVIDHFDAVKIGLTATPALHTTDIFGKPVFTYGYREAVIDGHLVDHEPPIQIETELSSSGIEWQVGETVEVYDSTSNTVATFETPDRIRLEIEDFNRRVVTESFNKVVCDYLAQHLDDPASGRKTLIFCATDAHADLVVKLLKESLATVYGEVDDDTVLKITGAADKPLELIRRYKNEKHPAIAVTVDLLTTGVDVPAICNLVFLRRVNSRILFDQMLGRATRPCPELEKGPFRIFDPVRIYEALEPLTDMKPVVTDPRITFAQLERELADAHGEAIRSLARDQFLAKLQAIKRHLGDDATRDFETRAGMSVDAFIRHLRQGDLAALSRWFATHPGLGEILDRKRIGPGAPLYISQHADALIGARHGYGNAQKPEDYLGAFACFIRDKSNNLPALKLALTRPRELTRKDLRELELALDAAGFATASLAAAYRETNRDIAARLLGYVRTAALGDPLIAYEQRVDDALARMIASRKDWTRPQLDWLRRIAAQTKANTLVDLDAVNDPDLIFKREGGGLTRLNNLFGGRFTEVLADFNDQLWQSAR